MRAELGLDRPWPAQFADWIADLARLDLGRSLVTGAPIVEELAVQLGYSLWLAAAALGLSLLVGPAIGVAAGLRPQGWVDRLGLAGSVALRASAALRAGPRADTGLRHPARLAAAGRLRHLAGDRAAGADAGPRPRRGVEPGDAGCGRRRRGVALVRLRPPQGAVGGGGGAPPRPAQRGDPRRLLSRAAGDLPGGGRRRGRDRSSPIRGSATPWSTPSSSATSRWSRARPWPWA